MEDNLELQVRELFELAGIPPVTTALLLQLEAEGRELIHEDCVKLLRAMEE